MANMVFLSRHLFSVYMPVYQPWAQTEEADTDNMNIHREALLPSSKTWTHAGIRCYSNERKKTTEIDLFHSTGKTAMSSPGCLYAAELLYMSQSHQNELKLLPSSSESHQSNKPQLRVYQRG